MGRYHVRTERHRCESIIVTSNHDPEEWLATFADPMRAQASALQPFRIDRVAGED